MNNQINMNQTFKKNKDLFNVPDGYFEKFPHKIISQINEIPAKSGHIPLLIIFKKQLTLAAAFIAFFLLSYGIFKIISSSFESNNNKLAQQSFNEVLIAKLDEADFIDALTSEFTLEPLNAETIENYLIDEQISEDVLQENINN